MSHKTKLPRRSSLRLAKYDYASPGSYFVTLCVDQHLSLFGEIREGVMHLNAAGAMVDTAWRALKEHFPAIALDAHIVMPNHLHGIIDLFYTPDGINAPALGKVINFFKSITTSDYCHGVNHQAWRAFQKRLWQRNYYEHIIRT